VYDLNAVDFMIDLIYEIYRKQKFIDKLII